MSKKFAVFFDGDNISSRYYDSIIAEAAKYGEIIIKRVYGDWTTPNMTSWKEQVFKSPIKVVQQFRFGENATDNSIIMDAMELLIQNTGIDSYCIVSSDADYYNLALRLREYGRFVLGIGKEDAKPLWKNACDQFILIENILSFKTEEKPSPEADDAYDAYKKDDMLDLHTILDFAFSNAKTDNDDWISLSNFGIAVCTRYPSFDPRTYNHNNLLSLLKAFADEHDIKKDELIPPNYWVRKKPKKDASEKQAGTIKRYLGSYGFIENSKGDFFFTVANIEKNSQGKKIRKGEKVLFKSIKDPDAAKETASEKNGKAVDVEIIE
jgi:cold shock CspA family protein